MHFFLKQINDNLDRFANTSSSNRHCTTMDTNMESFNCKKQRKIYKEESKETFSKKFQHFQNEFPKLSKESQEFRKEDFSFY